MNLSPYYNSLFILIIFSMGTAASIQPVQLDKKEILTISEKRRSYFQLHQGSLNYEVSGPRNLQIYSRRAVPEKNVKVWKFGYRIFIDDQTPVTVRHEKKNSKGVRSSQHPGHGFTKSGKYLIKIPEGAHTIRLEPLIKNSAPVLVRMISKKLKIPDAESKYIPPEGSNPLYHVVIGSKEIRYHELNSENPLIYNFDGSSHVEFINRLIFSDWMTGEEPFRIRIWEDDFVLGTYYFTTERSEQSSVAEDKMIIPGKWRSSVLELDKGTHHLKLELMDKGKRVFIRALFTPDE